MSGGLGNPPPLDGERSPTGETASKTWGQETGINAQAVTGIGQYTPLGDIGDAGTTSCPSQQVAVGERRLAYSSFHADLSDHGGLLGSEDSEDSGDEIDFPR